MRGPESEIPGVRRAVIWAGAGYAAGGVAIGHLNIAVLGTVILTTATLAAAWFPAARGIAFARVTAVSVDRDLVCDVLVRTGIPPTVMRRYVERD